MPNLNTQVKEFIQETLKIDGLIVAEELSSIASQLLNAKDAVFSIPSDKKKELDELLKKLNEELKAARENHEKISQKADGLESLIKPFSNVFNYISANTHEQRAKNLAAEAAKLFLREEGREMLKKALKESASKLQASNVSPEDKLSEGAKKLSQAKDNLLSDNDDTPMLKKGQKHSSHSGPLSHKTHTPENKPKMTPTSKKSLIKKHKVES